VHVLRVAAAALTLALLLPSHLSAAFHLMMVKEVYAGSASSPNAKYVVLQMWDIGQNFVQGHPLIFYNAAGVEIDRVTFPNHVNNGANQATILIATTDAQAAFGVNRDFTMSAAWLSAAGGKICFDTAFYDCVAWGNYSGSAANVGTPFNAAGGIPTGQAMRRRLDIAGSPTILEFADDTNNSANDFLAQSPKPINNAGQANSALVYVSDALGADTNPGTTASPVKTIAKGMALAGPVSGAREVRVGQGLYPEKVTMVEGVSLLGGYQCTVQPCSWTRDPLLYDSAIVNTDFQGVLAPDTITRATRLDGFRIDGLSGTPSLAPGGVAITVKGSPTIYGNRIFAGDTTGGIFSTGQSIGIAIVAPSNSAEGSLIEANQMTGGDSSFITAAILFDAGSPPGATSPAEIRNNTILGGTTATNSYGIAGWAAAPGTLVKGNEIRTGSSTGGSGESFGIALISTMTIDSNRINVDQVNVGTCAGTRWCGGIQSSGGSAVITNNVVFGAKATRSAAVLLAEFEVPNTSVALNANYLDGAGVGLTPATVSSAVALQISSCIPCGFNGLVGRIRNNILLGGLNQNRYGLYEDPAPMRTIRAEIVESNDFHFAPLPGRSDVLYHESNGLTGTDHTTFNTITAAWMANFAADPLVDSTFHLMTGSPCIDAGTNTEAPTLDFDGDTRPKGLAIDVGPDELLPPATSLVLEAPDNAIGGASFNVTVTLLDATSNIATGYRGTVHFTSNDAAAMLPADYTFTASDSGVHTFVVTLNTVGFFLVTATDGAASLTGGDSVLVRGNTTTMLTTSGSPSTVAQNVTFTATVTSAAIGTITGTVTFKDGGATIGTGTLGSPATFTTSTLSGGSHSITAHYEGDSNFNTSTSNVVTQVVNLAPFGAPAGFSATATGASSVALQWLPVNEATSYQVFRSTSLTGEYILAATSSASPTVDGLIASANTTYLYKVRAIRPAGPSDFSAIDSATTTVFTDADLFGVVIKADHVLELRTAVNAMRVAANLQATTFTDASLPGTIIKAEHISQLRTALDAARAAIGLPASSYVDNSIVQGVTTAKKEHVLQLRAATQ